MRHLFGSRSADQRADAIDDRCCGGEKLAGFDRSEIGEVRRVSAVDHPWVEQIEDVVGDMRRQGRGIESVQLAEIVDPWRTGAEC